MEMSDLNCAPTVDYDSQILESLTNNDVKQLIKTLKNADININKEYGYPHNKTIIQIACSKNDVSLEIVNYLIENGADLFMKNEHFKNKQCLHFAAEAGNMDVIKLIVNEYLKSDEGKLLLETSDVLIHLILYVFTFKKFAKSTKIVEPKYVEVVNLLLNYNVNVNVADSNGWTPIYAAAKYGFKEIIDLILKSDNLVHLDSFKGPKGKSARDLITENNLYDGELPSEMIDITTESLKNLLRTGNTSEFLINYEITQNMLTDDEKTGLLYVAVENNSCEIVKVLTKSLSDMSKVVDGYDKPVLQFACRDGYHKIVETLLDKPQNTECVSQSLVELSKQMHHNRDENDVDYERCVELLLKNSNVKVNKQDWNKNTALHYAAKYQKPEMVLQLLQKGASLASKNSFGVMAVADINAEILKAHLDECIVEGHEKHSDHESKYITINFTTLLLPRDETACANNNADDFKVNINQEPLLNDVEPEHKDVKVGEHASFYELLTEMDVLKYLSTSPELKPLLTHPVIMTFLYLKWFRIRKFFYINLAIYLTFFISLLTYVFFCYNQVLEKRSDTQQFIVNFSYIIVSIMLMLLAVRELAQIFIFKWRYLKIFENWLELTLLVVTLAIVVNQSEEVVIKQLAAVAILLSAIDLLLLVGQIPSLSTNIMMLRTVSLTFFKLLLWYSILIIAFALSFYTLFKKNETQPENSDENNFFIDPGLSMFKTIVMLTGEFDASDINFDTYPIISHLIFLSFVFLIAIVLFNLLNGLAVSDTQMIKSDAELYSQIVRVEHITHVERILLTRKFCRFMKYVRNICLFPSNVHKTEVKLYQHSNWEIKFSEDHEQTTNCYRCSQVVLDRKIQRKIKAVLHELKEEKFRAEKESSIAHRLDLLEKQQKEILHLLKLNAATYN